MDGMELPPTGWYAYVFEGGCFVLVDTAPFEAEVHVAIAPDGRGLRALERAREVFAMEMETGKVIVGRTPLAHRAARRFAALCGGAVVGVEDGEEVRVWAA